MVFCCGEIEALSPEEGVGGPSKYPGLRRPVPNKNLQQGHDGEDLVSVTVPLGVQPGQVLTVLAVDGTRRVKATVPAGLQAGDTFLVRLATPIHPQVLNSKPLQPPEQRTQPEEATTPARPESPEPNFASALDAWLTPSPDPPMPSTHSKSSEPTGSYHSSSLGHQTNHHHNYHQQHQQSFQQYPTHQSQALPRPLLPPLQSPQQVPGQSIAATVESPTSTTDSPHQKLLLVQVPPGMPPGSSLQVEIPGEHRTLTAQVPPGGVQSFHVAYSPRPPQYQPQPPPSVRNEVVSKLLLVRVPPGTAPGTTLHVSIPDEPGRILAAQVPAGNVPEFHVSYEPRVSSSSSSFHKMTASGYQQHHQQQTPYRS